jgi:hypothetical protein
VEASAFRPAFSNFLQMTILVDAMAFLIQQRILCGRIGITPCLSANLTGEQVAFGHCCVTPLVMAL